MRTRIPFLALVLVIATAWAMHAAMPPSASAQTTITDAELEN